MFISPLKISLIVTIVIFTFAEMYAQDFTPISVVDKLGKVEWSSSVVEISSLLRERKSYQGIKRNSAKLKRLLRNRKRTSIAVGAECIFKSDEWEGTVFDKIILLDDQSFKLKQAGMGSLQNNNTLKTKMANDLKSKLQTIASRDNLVTLNIVFMGHSVLGGYLARTFASTPQTFDLDNIVNQVTYGLAEVNFAAITFGTPHQGVGLSAVSVEPRSGFTNIAPTLTSFKGELEAGISEDVSKLAGFRYLFGDVLTVSFSPFIGGYELYCMFDPAWCHGNVDGPIEDAQKVGLDYLDATFISTQSFIGNKLSAITNQDVIDPLEAVFDYGLKELLKPDLGDGDQGLIIDQINALPDPEFYRNVFGAEKFPVPARVSSEIAVIDVDRPFIGVSFDDEKEFNETFGNAKEFAKLQKDTWWTEHQFLYYFVCWSKTGPAKKSCNAKKDRHKRRSRNWGRAERALNNIDATWGTLINANKYEQRTAYRRVYDPSLCEGGRGQIPGIFKYGSVENINMVFEEGGNCDPFRYEPFNYVAKIPLKNDGITTPNHSTWNKNDNIFSNSDNNFYYDDSGDGGYNHMEIRRLRRAYNDSGNGIVKGEKALPMEEAEEWVKLILLNN